MVIRVGINGFGRVGRIVFRKCFLHPEVEVAAINDPAVDIEYICYLIKFDSTHGKFNVDITHKGSEIHIDGRVVKVFHFKQPASIPWLTADTHYVVEASGMFSTLEKASGHLTNEGVKRVILTAPSVDIPMLVLGVNTDDITPDMKVLSCGSSTLYCLAPLIKLLTDTAGLQDGFVTSIHAMTPSLKPLDGLCLRGKHWREHRSITQNIIPASTGACKALGKIVPCARDKMSGLAFRVPIANVSVLDITVRLTNNTTLAAIYESVTKASMTKMQNIITISNEENVSSDFIGDIHSCILDTTSSQQLKPNFFKFVCWYENEYSYACRVVETILFSEKQFNQMAVTMKTTFVRPKLAISIKQDTPQQTECFIKELQRNHVIERRDDKKRIEVSHRVSSEMFPLKKTCEITLHVKTNEQIKTILDILDNKAKCSDKDVIENCDTLSTKERNSVLCPTAPAPLCTNTVTPTDCSKAQERLDKVKREFYKMVDMTEGLLKTSNSGKYKRSTTSSRNNSEEEFPDVIKANTTNENSNNNVIDTSPTKVLQKDVSIQLTRSFETRGDSTSNTSNTTCSKTLSNLTKEEIVGMTPYERESSYSVNEIKHFFENSQCMLNLRCQDRTVSPEKEITVKNIFDNIDTLDTRKSSEMDSDAFMRMEKLDQDLCSIKSSRKDVDARHKEFFNFENRNNTKDETVKPFNIDNLSHNGIVIKSLIPQKLVQNSAQIETKTNILHDSMIIQELTPKQPTIALPKVIDNQNNRILDNMPIDHRKPLSINSKHQNRSTECEKDIESSEPIRLSIGEQKSANLTSVETRDRDFREHTIREIQNSSVTVLDYKNMSNQLIERDESRTTNSNSIQSVDSKKREDFLPIKRYSKTFCSILEGLSKNYQSITGKGNHAGVAPENRPHDHYVDKIDTPGITKNRNLSIDSFKKPQFVEVLGKTDVDNSATVLITSDNKSQNQIACWGKNSVIVDIDLRKVKPSDTTTTEPHNVDQDIKKKRIIGNQIVLTLDKKNEKRSKASLVSDVISEVPDEEEVSYEKEDTGNTIIGSVKFFDETVPTKPAIELPITCMNDFNDSVTRDNVEYKVVPQGDDTSKKVDQKHPIPNQKISEHTIDDVDYMLQNDTKCTMTKTKMNKNDTSQKSYDISSKSSLEPLAVIDEELKRRNIKLVPETTERTKATADHKDPVLQKYKLVGQYLEDIESYNRCIARPERPGSSSCSSPLSSYTEGFFKQDLYDKLDSDSASDSGNSIAIDRRKSQVLSIKDLTNSLDDLERLDKICRIIEISDDLSDQLFSNLNFETKCKTAQKWSFRDLCEKIKLDEFCRNVFGK